jgi:CBS domain-containing protein
VETSAISYRVADFLKQYPPFTAIDEKDLVGLAAFGRVRFFEAHEFLMWQGEPHKAHIFVIQQGTVSLWDERGGRAELRDVRGAGDLIGGEQFHGERACLYTAQATSDVVIYGFPAQDFEALLDRYPYAAKFVAALGTVTTDFQRTDEQADPRRMFLHQVASPLQTCAPATTVAEAARLLARSGADAMAVAEGEELRGLVSASALLLWLADGGSGDRPVSDLRVALPPTVGPDASVTDGVLAMGTADVPAVAMTADGTSTGRLLSVLTPRDVAPAFGDQPAVILRDIRRATDIASLRALNQRARACALHHLTSAGSADWILRFTDAVDVAILKRLFVLTAQDDAAGCWCVCGASGRGESISMQIPAPMDPSCWPRMPGPSTASASAAIWPAWRRPTTRRSTRRPPPSGRAATSRGSRTL